VPKILVATEQNFVARDLCTPERYYFLQSCGFVFLSEVLTFERDRTAPEKQSTAVSMYWNFFGTINHNG
jgi:hypothetical protein